MTSLAVVTDSVIGLIPHPVRKRTVAEHFPSKVSLGLQSLMRRHLLNLESNVDKIYEVCFTYCVGNSDFDTKRPLYRIRCSATRLRHK